MKEKTECYNTVLELADKLNKHPQTIRRWISKGRLKAVKIGGGVFIPESEIQSMTKPY